MKDQAFLKGKYIIHLKIILCLKKNDRKVAVPVKITIRVISCNINRVGAVNVRYNHTKLYLAKGSEK